MIQSEVSQKEKHQYSILMHIYGIWKDDNNNPVYETAKETVMYRTVLWTLWERERVGRFGRMGLGRRNAIRDSPAREYRGRRHTGSDECPPI